jgi:hypothetical protein
MLETIESLGVLFLLLFGLLGNYYLSKVRTGNNGLPNQRLPNSSSEPNHALPIPSQSIISVYSISKWPTSVGGKKLHSKSPRPFKPGDKSSPRYPRLSKPVPTMRPEYDIVVIGSGYGGAIAASRMARAGKSVCVLERGCEKWPGEYPSALKDCAREFHVSGYIPTKGLENGNNGIWDNIGGKPTGMYHLTKGEGQDVFVANGLGGTSLINANVFLRADHRTLELSEWPATIREDPVGLDKCKCPRSQPWIVYC